MKLTISIRNKFSETLYAGRIVPVRQTVHKGGKCPTNYTFGQPYSRVYQDDEGLFIMSNGNRKAVTVVMS